MLSDLRFREFNSLKIWHHADRLAALAAGRDVAPVTVEVDPVAYCNHRCAWCVDPAHRPVAASRDFLWMLLAELATFRVNGFGVHGVVFKGGGEPTLHPDFPALVQHARGLGFEVGVVTNGSRLLAFGMAEALAASASYVRISIDGPTPETHARIHGSHDFMEITAGVQRLVALRQKRHPIIGLSFAMDHPLIPLIPEAIALGEQVKADYVLIRPPFFEEVGRPATMTAIQATELRQALAAAARCYRGSLDVLVGAWIGDAERASQTVENSGLDASGRRDLQLAVDLPIEHRLARCWASPLLAVVAADSQVYGCCNLRFLDEWSFGRVDYARGVSLSTIWKGDQRHQVFSKMETTACIAHCTHPLARYNDVIAVLRDSARPHSAFV
jgi:hypothetical protein